MLHLFRHEMRCQGKRKKERKKLREKGKGEEPEEVMGDGRVGKEMNASGG